MFLIVAFSISFLTNASLDTQLVTSPGLIFVSLFFAVSQGATGEESGWRGYLLPRMESKFGFLKGNIVLGLVWGFWHLPLWFISVEYQGLELLLYILGFLGGIVTFSMFIGIIMKKCNLLFKKWLWHFG